MVFDGSQAIRSDADQALRWLNEMGIVIVDADIKLTQLAASFKAKGGIAYANCLAAALTKVRTTSGSDQSSATLVTGDKGFKPLEAEISITWLPSAATPSTPTSATSKT